jgi:signal transduction histidine kinase
MADIDARTLQLLIDASADGVLVLDEEHRVSYANAAAARLLGNSMEQLVGAEFGYPLVPGEKTEIELHHVEPPRVTELRAGEAQTPQGLRRIVTLRDVTEAAQRLDEVLGQVTQRSDALNMIAHELRSPLAVIIGYASMLEEGAAGELPPAAQRMVGSILRKSAGLRQAVEQLLAAARLDRNHMSTRQERLDLGDVARAALERNRPRAELLGATLALEVSDVPLCVDADREQLGTVLDNFIGNALVHCPAPVAITVGTVAGGDGEALVTVRDDGPGIAPADHERIFQAFERAGDESAAEGTGLGLSIAVRLAELNGGHVGLLSSDEGGSCFALRLPLAGGAAR